ncbi:EpsG family protein [Bifidobacterium criceti]|uniref:EpsG family n=1 Tax=Bifidobacterium criceti TaxID=1960969 RepID=A0A2A2EI81_9BIFI|nr:EpsG family protein [Bifidobacterium criceti]PAU68636.1 EpsG family [Bifidobacterium criceti]
MKLYLLVFFAAVAFAFVADVMQRQITGMEERGNLSLHARRSLVSLRSSRVVVIMCSALVYILLSGMRYDTGFDYMYSYVPSLEEVRRGNASHYDPFFDLVIAAFAKFSSNQWFFAGMALYTIAMIYIGFCMESKYVLVPVALFFTSFNYLRSFCFVAQYVAMATLFVGFLLLLKKRYVGAVALLILGILLHKSAEVMIIFYVLYFLSNKILLALAALLPLFGMLGQGPVRSVLVKLTGDSRFAVYINGQFDVGYADMSLVYANLAFFVLFLVIVFITRDNITHDKQGTMYVVAQSLALGFAFLQIVIPVGYRFVWYFAFFQLVSVPYMLRKVTKGTLYYAICTGICVLYYIWMVRYPLTNGASQVLPYHPFFDPNVTIW